MNLHDNKLNDAKSRLAKIVRSLADSKANELNRRKRKVKEIDRPDFLWHYLLQSFATMGRSSGWFGLYGSEEYKENKVKHYDCVTYEALQVLRVDSDRRKRLQKILRSAKVRMPDKKAEFLLGCYRHIHSLGGLVAAKNALLAEPGAEGKMRFLRGLPGIGPKYARNIMMDVYHPEFRDYIAVDARIKSITRLLGVDFSSCNKRVEYENTELFYLDVARMAEVEGWEIDRVLYNYSNEIKEALS